MLISTEELDKRVAALQQRRRVVVLVQDPHEQPDWWWHDVEDPELQNGPHTSYWGALCEAADMPLIPPGMMVRPIYELNPGETFLRVGDEREWTVLRQDPIGTTDVSSRPGQKIALPYLERVLTKRKAVAPAAAMVLPTVMKRPASPVAVRKPVVPVLSVALPPLQPLPQPTVPEPSAPLPPPNPRPVYRDLSAKQRWRTAGAF